MPASPRLESDPNTIHVLVIDDESPIVEEILEFFLDEGIAATSASNANAASRQIEQTPPGTITVILTDVRMPGRDGLSLARDILGGSSEANAVEIVVMTGHGDMAMAIDALRTRVFDFIDKPLSLAALDETVRRAHASAMARRQRHADHAEALARLRAEAQTLSTRIAAMSARADGPDERSRSAILAIVSDELRNPLVPIVGLAEVIEEDNAALLPAQITEFARLIRKAGERLTGLIDALLNMAALEGGGRDTQPRPEKAREIVAMLAREHAAEAGERGQTIDAPQPADFVVNIDHRCLLIALNQLVSNAVCFGPEGQVVRIEAEMVGGEVIFRVIDSGPGMIESELQALRKPFRRGDMSLTRATRGLGLGLSLAERAVAALHGRLELTSVPGSGTTAAVVLPAFPASPG
jgi:signal transduction histidine kinase